MGIIRYLADHTSAIDSLHWEIDSELFEKNKEYEETFSKYENLYNHIKRLINRKIWAVAYTEKNTPTMDIPYFNSDLSKCVSFKDLFIESIHSNHSIRLTLRKCNF